MMRYSKTENNGMAIGQGGLLQASDPPPYWLRRGGVTAGLLVLYCILYYIYQHIVVPIYAFGGFIDKPSANQWAPLLLVILTGLVAPLSIARMSNLFVWISILFLLLPATVLSATESADMWALLIMYMGVGLVKAFCLLFDRVGLWSSWGTKVSERTEISLPFLVIILFIVLVVLAIHVGGEMNFSLQDVYEFRFDFNDNLTFPLNYLLPFAAGPLAGFAAAASMEKKNYFTIAVIVLFGIFYFGFSSHKALLFNPPFAIAIYIMLRHEKGLLFLLFGFFTLSVITLFASGSLASLMGASFANRIAFIPAQIHYVFFQQFSEIGFQYWAESRFGLGLFQSRLPINVVNYVALIMTGDPSIGANTGWLANGYINAGIAGVAAYALILAVMLHILDLFGKKYGYAFVGAAFLIPILNIVNAIDLLAGFLTGGLLLLFVLFLLTVRQVRSAEPAL